MTQNLTIALDAMGGDKAPQIVVGGANLARKEYSNVRFIFFGDQKKINKLLDKNPELQEVSEVHHTDEVISNEIKPSAALRNGRQSSMRLAIDAVSAGDADCVVSAGNTGALMAMAKFSLKSLSGIDRPAIATCFPTTNNNGTVVLDLGANLNCNARNLVQFALLGMVYAKNVLGVEIPRVGLLNIGAEEMKGRDEIREASQILNNIEGLPGRFDGFVEGDDLLRGEVEVIVTDGFTGNIALKTMEGTAKYLSKTLKKTLKSSPLAMLGAMLAGPALKGLGEHMDPRRYNGGMLMGLRGICIKSHGGTDSLGFAHAIGVGADMVLTGFNDKVKARLEEVETVLESAFLDVEEGASR